jgi:hypothetical protein
LKLIDPEVDIIPEYAINLVDVIDSDLVLGFGHEHEIALALRITNRLRQFRDKCLVFDRINAFQIDVEVDWLVKITEEETFDFGCPEINAVVKEGLLYCSFAVLCLNEIENVVAHGHRLSVGPLKYCRSINLIKEFDCPLHVFTGKFPPLCHFRRLRKMLITANKASDFMYTITEEERRVFTGRLRSIRGKVLVCAPG